jgi:predicted DNA-binding transcriptional regulator YafY
MIENKKTSILLILKVLEEYTDENHYLTYQQIIDKIQLLYGIKLERKSIASSIEYLQELDYDIDKKERGGVCLLSRDLEKSEITFLIDAIFSSKSIPGKEAKALADKISKNLSIYDRRNYDYLHKTSEVNRTGNKEIFLNIELIQEAINRGKRISFQYLTYNEKGKKIPRMNGYEYTVSPYYLVNNYGHYYLLANYRSKYAFIQTFRIDYMINLKIDETRDIKPLKGLDDSLKNFSLAKYLNEHVYLFGGDAVEVKIQIKDPGAIGYIYDNFGNVKIQNENGVITTTLKSNESALVYWLLQYGEHFKVLEPLSFKEKLIEKAKKIIEE